MAFLAAVGEGLLDTSASPFDSDPFTKQFEVT